MSAGGVVRLTALLGAGEARAADEYMYVVNGTGRFDDRLAADMGGLPLNSAHPRMRVA
ncbi:MAG: hypothetical protein JNL41_10370 [Phenylobacterium sp.]|uniref:hypothetical protein n=1 Tax=Phenylobacterium sp. TaxID=1871053 RepID=UPI001A502F7D|nr:hypothetical protein [Phenylobacterium sp.]MBL8554671.1 hypothetical protein [Phenylobacterium sp.]